MPCSRGKRAGAISWDRSNAPFTLAAQAVEGETEAMLVEAAALCKPLAAVCGADTERFLAELSVGAQVDTWDPRADRIALLTLHAAKGLEFPVVFIVGCEDGILTSDVGRGDGC